MQQNGQLRPTNLRVITDSPAFRDKLAAMLGPQGADSFISQVRQEVNLARSGGRMLSRTNSSTGDILNAANDQDELFNNLETGMNVAHGIGHALSLNVPGMLRSGMNVARSLGVGSASMPENVRNIAGHLLLMPPADAARYLQNVVPINAARGSVGASRLPMLLGPYLAASQGQ